MRRQPGSPPESQMVSQRRDLNQEWEKEQAGRYCECNELEETMALKRRHTWNLATGDFSYQIIHLVTYTRGFGHCLSAGSALNTYIFFNWNMFQLAKGFQTVKLTGTREGLETSLHRSWGKCRQILPKAMAIFFENWLLEIFYGFLYFYMEYYFLRISLCMLNHGIFFSFMIKKKQISYSVGFSRSIWWANGYTLN